ncbi:mechanosensitive ion channel family protein [Acinetobacter wuhouensis]|uniref:Small-conductance mechanosensitive channel n=1 Tax=Acinetobacter wuhouensis TaxID=1879050 RepID=A0A385C825_9GAMM|nr:MULTISPECIES: mechanosensitive ion channel family protein [Acinetobacter]AXQ23867.1 mechanosensitive ion channel family protein [Acinetobacter wuhouensis]AYO52840.1 mechanosensitive ion channel family protein [Acinetobacter wuhouensis]RZG45345.1 mechanosensitive ion channel family protein [Acinetobacter wuhouensis]RZG75896.1 mechanosensitive ion channel family protein [Acinetobacter wuhouensis]RZG76905.1 mechanosensitive ion channel family protein [Acinetobacter sp. WCHAc060025]
MAEEANKLSEVAQDTTQLIQSAGEKTAQSVIQHTAKYNDAYSTIDKFVDGFWERLPYLTIALVVITIFWLLSKLFKFFVRKTLSNRNYTRQNLVLVLNRVGSTAIMFFGFLIAMVIAIPGFTPGQLMSALGIGSVAIGFAFKDIFQNLLSGILILISEPFKIGDDIIVTGMEGTVEDIQIRATFLRSPDGRRIVIPNATVYTSAVTVNTAYPRRRCEFVVGIGYEDDVQKAKDIILKLLDKDQRILSQPGFSVNVTALADFSVNLTVRWWVDTSQVLTASSISEIQELVLDAFAENNISIPYPVQEVKVYRGDPSVDENDSGRAK